MPAVAEEPEAEQVPCPVAPAVDGTGAPALPLRVRKRRQRAPAGGVEAARQAAGAGRRTMRQRRRRAADRAGAGATAAAAALVGERPSPAAAAASAASGVAVACGSVWDAPEQVLINVCAAGRQAAGVDTRAGRHALQQQMAQRFPHTDLPALPPGSCVVVGVGGLRRVANLYVPRTRPAAVRLSESDADAPGGDVDDSQYADEEEAELAFRVAWSKLIATPGLHSVAIAGGCGGVAGSVWQERLRVMQKSVGETPVPLRLAVYFKPEEPQDGWTQPPTDGGERASGRRARRMRRRLRKERSSTDAGAPALPVKGAARTTMRLLSVSDARRFSVRHTRRVAVQLEGFRLAAFVDGGSDVSAVSESWARARLPDYEERLRPERVAILEATASTENESAVRGSLELELQYGGEHECRQKLQVLVIRGLNYDFLLGSDELEERQAVKSYADNTLTLTVETEDGRPAQVALPLIRVGQLGQAAATAGVWIQRLALTEDWVIPAGHSADLPTFAEAPPCSPSVVLTEPLTRAQCRAWDCILPAGAEQLIGAGIAEAGDAESPEFQQHMCEEDGRASGCHGERRCKGPCGADCGHGGPRKGHLNTSQELDAPGAVPVRVWNAGGKPVRLTAGQVLTTGSFIPRNNVLRVTAAKLHALDDEALPFARGGERDERGRPGRRGDGRGPGARGSGVLGGRGRGVDGSS